MRENFSFFTLVLSACTYGLFACNEPEAKSTRTRKDYIRAIPGDGDPIPDSVAQKGEVLIAYSDCSTCHKRDRRSVGPAFQDIAKRYPAKPVYIELLAQRVISGGSGSWGHAVMSAHPKIPPEDAKTMVSYILSLKEE